MPQHHRRQCQDCHFSLQDVPYLSSCQQAGSCLAFGSILGKFEEFLLSLTDVSSCGWDPLASPAVSRAALSSLPLTECFGTNRKGRTGSLWRHCCLEILHLTLEQLSFVSKQVPAWHCQPQAELNPSSGNELCHSWNRKAKLDFATHLFCPF